MAGPPLSRRHAEMAANESQTDDSAMSRSQAVEADYDDVSTNEVKKTTAELEAERDRLAKQLAETNRKAKADRHELEEFKKAKQEAEEAKLGEGDRLKRERDTIASERARFQNEAKAAKDELDRVKLDFEIERMAGPSGFNFTYPETAAKLVDRDLIEYDDDNGKPLNLKDVLKRLTEKFPNLVNAAPARAGTPPRTGQMGRQGQATEPRYGEPLPIELDLMRKVKYPGR